MTAATTGSTDLILRILDGSNENALISVNAKSYKLTDGFEGSEPTHSNTEMECMIERDEKGAFLVAAKDGLQKNGQLVAVGQSERLQGGDQIEMGACRFEVLQLGKFQEQVSPGTEQPKDDTKPANGNELENRFEKIEMELGRQSESFANVNQRFDDLNHQLSSLVNAVSGLGNQNQQSQSELNAQPGVDEYQNQDRREDNPGADCNMTETEELPVENSQLEQISQPENIEDCDMTCDTTPIPGNESAATDQLAELQSAIQPAADSPSHPLCEQECESETECVGEREPGRQPELAQSEVSIEQPLNVQNTANEELADSVQNEIDQAPVADFESKASILPENHNEEESEQQLALERLLSSLKESTSPAEEPAVASAMEDGNEVVAEQAMVNPSDEIQPSEMATVEPEEQLEQELPAVEENQNDKLENLFAELRERDQRTVDNSEPSDEINPIDNLSGLDQELSSKPAQEQNPIERNQVDDVECSYSNQPTDMDDPMASVNQLFKRLSENDKECNDEPELESGLSQRPEPEHSAISDSANAEAQVESVIPVTSSMVEPVATPAIESAGSPEERSAIPAMELTNTDSAIPNHNSQAPPNLELTKVEPAKSESLQSEPDVSSEPEPNQSSESVSDILARLNMSPNVDSDVDSPVESNSIDDTIANDEMSPVHEASQQTPMEQPEPAAAVAPAEPVAVQPREGSEDVQDYMNSLLQRLNGGVASQPAAAATESISPSVSTAVVDEAEVEEVVKPLNPDEFVPQRVAPERNSNLAAMRELANSSSRSALESSAIKRKKDLANAMLLGCGGAVIGAATSGFLSQASGDIFSLLAIGLALVAIGCGAFYVKDNLFAGKAKSNSNQQPGTLMLMINDLKDKILKKLSRDPEVGN